MKRSLSIKKEKVTKKEARSGTEELKGAQSAWRKAGWGSGFDISQSLYEWRGFNGCVSSDLAHHSFCSAEAALLSS